MRTLIEKNMIPDDVTVQVLTQAREHIIKKTFEAVEGRPTRLSIFTTQPLWRSVSKCLERVKRRLKRLPWPGPSF